MKKSAGLLLMIGISTLSLSGCWYQFHRVAGPCYGAGCPAFTASAQPKVAAAPKAPDANAQAHSTGSADTNPAGASQASPSQGQASQADSNQAKPGKITRMLSALHLHSKS